MKNIFCKSVTLVLLLMVVIKTNGQYNWKFTKEKDGIKIYESEIKNTNLKAVKVECVLTGTYDKLIAVLNDVPNQKAWVYSLKTSYVIKKNSFYDFYYYTETSVPWPLSNRDAIIHLMMTKDSAGRFLKINGTAVPNYIPEKDGKVRVKKVLINWYVTAPTPTTIHIVYTIEVDPAGSIPAWLVNMFADKGPLESFRSMSRILKQ